MKFDFKYSNSYGNKRYYPVSENAKQLLKLMKRVCLNQEHYDYLKASGWPIFVTAELWTLSQTDHP